MSLVAERLSYTHPGKFPVHLNLDLYPLLGGQQAEPSHLLLDEVSEQGNVDVAEVPESGSVPQPQFVNEAERLRRTDIPLRRRRGLSS